MKKAIKKTGMVERKECVMASSELRRLTEKIRWPKKEVATKIKKTKKVAKLDCSISKNSRFLPELRMESPILSNVA